MAKHLSKTNSGVAALPTILMLGFIILEIGLALIFISYYTVLSLQSDRLANQLFYAARAGAQDGILQVIRNKDFFSSGYNLSVAGGTAQIVVTPNSPSVNKTTITSTATFLTRQKKVQTILTVDPTTGLVTIGAIQELQL